jgi:hypothetical protein
MDDPNMPPRTPSFLDQFILHLAAHLLGVDTVLEKLQPPNLSNKKNDGTTVSLFYWRTKLLLGDDPSCLLNGTYTEEASTLFLDLKISWNTKQPGMELQFGAMILQQPQCTYIQSIPLTIQQLESHAQSVGLDMYSAPDASAMAQAVGRALLDANAPKVNGMEESASSPQTTFQIQLYYPDVQETGTLNLNVLHQTSQFDSVGMSLFFWDLTNRVPPPPPPRKLQQVLSLSSNNNSEQQDQQKKNHPLLEQALNKWFLAADLELAKQQSDARTLSSSATTDDNDNDNKPLTTVSSSSSNQKNDDTTTANKPSRVLRPVPGYAQLSGTKRRKKGKLSYAKPAAV